MALTDLRATRLHRRRDLPSCVVYSGPATVRRFLETPDAKIPSC